MGGAETGLLPRAVAGVKRRLADEYDAAQERGEIKTQFGTSATCTGAPRLL
jgi:hypothetical protein